MTSFFSMKQLRGFFPQIAYLSREQEAYLDSASTSLKLQCGLDTMNRFYEREVSNVHRGDHHLSLKAVEKYERARESVAGFLGASSYEEIIFTRGTTEGINMLAYSFESLLKEGDEIIVSEMEHHSNLIPWQILAKRKNLKLKFIPVTEKGELDIQAFKKFLNKKTKILSLIHISNALGTINPIKNLIQEAKSVGTLTVVDGAQSTSFMDINVKNLNCDFFVFSGHKVFAPSGIGVLYGKKDILDKLSPYQTGGGMISDVHKQSADWASGPQKFEAGTPFIEGALALESCLNFLKDHLDFKQLMKFERSLVSQAEEALSEIPGFKRIGRAKETANILSFIVEGLHSSDLSFIMTKEKVALRAGHHCCIPLMKKLKLSSGTMRASFSIYNSEEDVVMLKQALLKAVSLLRAS